MFGEYGPDLFRRLQIRPTESLKEIYLLTNGIPMQ